MQQWCEKSELDTEQQKSQEEEDSKDGCVCASRSRTSLSLFLFSFHVKSGSLIFVVRSLHATNDAMDKASEREEREPI